MRGDIADHECRHAAGEFEPMQAGMRRRQVLDRATPWPDAARGRCAGAWRAVRWPPLRQPGRCRRLQLLPQQEPGCALLLRNDGSRARYEHQLAGVNSRTDELQAALLRWLGADNAWRRAVALGCLEALRDLTGLALPPADEAQVQHVIGAVCTAYGASA